MAALYPGALDVWPTNHQDNVGEEILAQTINNNSDSINKIEGELGILPKGNYADVVTRLNTLEFLVFNVVNLANYQIALSDISKVVSMIFATASTVTAPANATVAFPIGTQIMVRQAPAAGTVSIVGAAGVTIESRGSSFSLAGPLSWVTMIKVGTNVWDLVGDLA